MVRSGFHNSLGTDIRTYYNSDFSHLMSLMIKDGIHQNYGHQFITLPGSGLEVIVQTGECWFNEVWVRNDADLPITVPAAPIVSGYSRIDAVAIKIDNTTAVREGTIEYVAGAASSTPSAPVLTDTDDVHWHLICLVTVPANATSINAANVENKIGTTTTPFITGILSTIDITTLLNQWSGQFSDWMSNNDAEFQEWFAENTSEFQTWFQHMKDQLTEDAAGHLQEEIDKFNINTSDYADGTSIELGIKNLVDSWSEDGTYSGRFKATITPEQWFSFQIDRYDEYASGYIICTTDPDIRYTVRYHIGTDMQATISPFKQRHTETFSPTSRANNLDMGLYHAKRYVDTTAVPNINTETYTFPANDTGATKDLGVNNAYRYANAQNVYSKGVTDGRSGYIVKPTATKNITGNGNNIDVLNYAKVNVSVWNQLNIQDLGNYVPQTLYRFNMSIGSILILGNEVGEPSSYFTGLSRVATFNQAGFQCCMYLVTAPTIQFKIASTSGRIVQIYRS